MDKIIVKGARENNLKNINIEIPKNKLVVMTGVSGSGKSSLAFDTIYAEGERRYIESLSAYARQFLGGSEKPAVDSIEGLSPSISIDQKSTNNNPRSTVGTVTEIYDYLRLLFARIGTPYCPNHHKPITSQSVEEMTNKVLEYSEGTKLEVLSPVVHGEKGTQKDLFDTLRKDGYTRVRIDGDTHDLSEELSLEKNNKHNIEVVIDRIVIKEDIRSRLFEAIETATKLSQGKVAINIIGDKEIVMSESYACPDCDFSLPELEPRIFSFNAPYGACPACKGLGFTKHIDLDLLIPDKSKSILEGAIETFNLDNTIESNKLFTVCKELNIDLSTPINKMNKKDLDVILYGSNYFFDFDFVSKNGNTRHTTDTYEGIVTQLERRYIETNSGWIREWIDRYMNDTTCDVCHGSRLKSEILNILINKKSIWDIVQMSIKDLIIFFDNLKLTEQEKEISDLIIKEIKSRL